MRKEYFHTQEKRDTRLTEPIPCKREDAWMGYGYYFWEIIDEAHIWGYKSKGNPSGCYEIYSAQIDLTNIFDSVYNLKHKEELKFLINYTLVKLIIADDQKRQPYIYEVFKWLREHKFFDKYEGIQIEDYPPSSKIKGFIFESRVQLVAFDKNKIITDFRFKCEGKTKWKA